jgi:hypothetical protein
MFDGFQVALKRGMVLGAAEPIPMGRQFMLPERAASEVVLVVVLVLTVLIFWSKG